MIAKKAARGCQTAAENYEIYLCDILSGVCLFLKIEKDAVAHYIQIYVATVVGNLWFKKKTYFKPDYIRAKVYIVYYFISGYTKLETL